jgi:transcriptional regulator with PAS, ATPase and Fis domain
VEKGRERTLTAVRSPFRQADEATIPVLFSAGRGGPAATGPRPRRFLPLGDQLLLRRGAPGEGDVVDSDSWALDDALVSGRHARLQRTATGMVLEDLGSKNGTYLGAERLVSPVALAEGAPFFAGEHAFLWRLISPATLQALEEEAADPLAPVATASPALALVNQKLRRWAGSGEEILLVGETGVGKEVCAQAVHRRSGRSGELVPLNCAALPAELVESELFGYRPGAHSTARVGKPGLVERAAGGTLFLDEVGEMPTEVQAKLLRFLQDRQLVPLGGTRPRDLDVRVLAATNRPVDPGLPGALRSDLLGRLGAAPVVLPPLRERLEDLGALANHFLARTPAGAMGLDSAAFRALFAYSWPLNVRELEKIIGAAARLTAGQRPIALRDLPQAVATPGSAPAAAPPAPPPASTPSGRRPPSPGPSREQLEALLVEHQGNVADVSRALGRQRAAVWRWIKRFGLGVDQHREK